MTSRWNDPRYLRRQQYRDAANLNARASLHARFSTNPQGWLRWVFAQLEIRPGDRVLEVGCGSGALWGENRSLVPTGCRITLTDHSLGMVQAARRTLGNHSVRFGLADAQALPFPNATFDVVIANHMLFHVPDIARALMQVQRLLKVGGALYAATNGPAHMLELEYLINEFDTQTYSPKPPLHFDLQNGAHQLAPWFSHIELRPYPDSLAVTEAEPLADYVTSMTGLHLDLSTSEKYEAFKAHLQTKLDADGIIRIHKDVGLFIARP